MSAIAGEISFTSNLSARIEEFEEMKKQLTYRGNDEQASYVSNSVALIQNLTCTGCKPIEPLPFSVRHGDKKYIIILDGMLTNRDEVIAALSKKGCKPQEKNDFELILLGYIHYGYDILNLINGVYAFAIWDFDKEELFLARDRMGVKPLFYSVNNGNLIFASEIKSLLENKEIRPVIDFNSLMELMLIGPGRTLGYGVFRQIEELKPAHYAVFSKKGLKTERYWDFYAEEHTDSFEDTVEKVRYLVTDSVEKQLESDFPVCTMLSGGLDSSIITSIAARVLNNNSAKLKTFSVTYKDQEKYFKKNRFQPDSDKKYIELMKEYLDIENETYETDSEELVQALYDAVDARDLPGMADVDASLLLFSKHIRKQYKTALSGECSDELFGGYPWYRDPKADNPNGFPWAHSDEFRRKLIREDILNGFNTQEYVYSKYISTVNSTPKLSAKDPDRRKKELMKLNCDWFMMTLIDRTDRMCSRCSLDVRVPFCDYRIAQYLFNVPWKYKDYNGCEKGLLREAFRDYLPDTVLRRKKSPYPKTHNPEYLYLVRDELRKITENENEPIFDFVKRSELIKLLNEEIPDNFYGQLMTTPQTIAYFLQMNYWLKKYSVEIE